MLVFNLQLREKIFSFSPNKYYEYVALRPLSLKSVAHLREGPGGWVQTPPVPEKKLLITLGIYLFGSFFVLNLISE